MTERPEPPQGKRIVVCLDGTANQIGAGNLTNVAKLFELLDKNDPSTQLVYYDPGVGTLAPAAAHSAVRRSVSLLIEKAFGAGLKDNVAQAYRYVMEHWRPRRCGVHLRFQPRRVHGASPGGHAAAAGADAARFGEPAALSDRKVRHQPGFHARRVRPVGRVRPRVLLAHRRRAAVFDRAPEQSESGVALRGTVAYLGLWDTVKAAGFLRFGTLRWPYTRSLPNVARIRHAVSIDERRRPYREYLVQRHPHGLEERWFAGVHADVGGTFMPDHRLATIALKWIVDGAVGDLAIDVDAYRAQCAMTEDFAGAPIHSNGKLWYLVGRRRRPMGPDALVHPSVLVRRRDDPGYLPDLTAGQQQLSADPKDWMSPAL